tara:strand:+ start:1471 stop:2646 length:1176 start_codon:yes stop_codon:yes gene_type:complete
MGFKTSLSNLGSSNGGNKQSSRSSAIFGRVVDIILDEEHPEYKNKGGGLSINGVFYKTLGANQKEVTPNLLPFALQSSAHIKIIPIIGEIVEIKQMPNLSTTTSEKASQKYYTGIVNTWNNANSGAYPDLVNNPDLDITSGGTFKELSKVNPIRSTPGDVQIEGRQGQSIRFTGGKGSSNPWIDDENIGSPVTIISNGQSDTEEGFSTLGESIDEDNCSIYLVSNHQIPLTPASEKRESCDEEPEKSDQFKGSQILLNAGRIYLNAKESDIQLSSTKSIGLNTEGSINIDGSSYLCLDAPILYLGSKARTSPSSNREAVLLGNQTEGFLQNILILLEGMAKDMASAKTIKGHPIPSLNKRGMQAQPVIRQLKNLINPNGPSQLKSKKVFTE